MPWLNAREDADAYSATVSVLFSIVMLLQIWTVAFGLYGAAPKVACCALQPDLPGFSSTAVGVCVVKTKFQRTQPRVESL